MTNLPLVHHHYSGAWTTTLTLRVCFSGGLPFFLSRAPFFWHPVPIMYSYGHSLSNVFVTSCFPYLHHSVDVNPPPIKLMSNVDIRKHAAHWPVPDTVIRTGRKTRPRTLSWPPSTLNHSKAARIYTVFPRDGSPLSFARMQMWRGFCTHRCSRHFI